jgi:ATP-dependent helicase/nuclease subunit B
VAVREARAVRTGDVTRLSVAALETLARSQAGDVTELYRGEAGEALVSFLRELVSSEAPFEFAAAEWPDVFAALIATETVKPGPGADPRVSIWGTLEARLQSVDTIVLGGLNEGTWPRSAVSDRFMSRLMKSEIELEPPERRIGQAAHDFMMALGTPKVVLSRAARAGASPAVPSRWLQRLVAAAGEEQAEAMRARGRMLTGWAHALDERPALPFAERPCPTPPLEARPTRFSVTEIETLRRDPYAVYARRILRLVPLEPLIRDPGAAERGNLFHDILCRFIGAGVDPTAPEALQRLRRVAYNAFAEAALPPDIQAVWWPRFERTALEIVEWERKRAAGIKARYPEIRAKPFPVGRTGKTLSGFADRIDVRVDGTADILDYKTGASPSKGQAHTLLAPQLALEAALLMRGAFENLPALTPARLAYVRLKANGEVVEESILRHNGSERAAPALAEEAWRRLEELLAHYDDPESGYLSRALPFREADTEGDYDHLARVLEWSAGGDDAEAPGDAS